jgi:hypothetical protein
MAAIGNQIDATLILARSDFVNVHARSSLWMRLLAKNHNVEGAPHH